MSLIEYLLSDQSYLVSLVQVLLDGVLIICFFLLYNRRPAPPEGAEELKERLQGLLDDMNEMASQFSVNLEERKVIIQKVVARLDEKILEADRLCRTLDEKASKAQSVPIAQIMTPAVHQQKSGDTDQVLRLARRGLDAGAIAKRLQKPIGEVELILSLQKLSSK